MKSIRGLVGECNVPGSPDLSLMALSVAAKGSGVSEIRRCSRRPEVDPLVEVLKQAGVEIRRTRGSVKVTGGPLKALEAPVEVGQSGLLLSCVAGLFGGATFQTKVEGNPACSKTVGAIVEAFKALGGAVSLPVEGVFPIGFGGRAMKAGTHQIGPPDTAVKCAVLLAGLDVEGEVVLVQETAGDDDLECLFQAAEVPFEKVKEPGVEGHRLMLKEPKQVQGAVHDLPGDPETALYLLGMAGVLTRSDLTVGYVGNDFKTRRILELLRRFNVQLEIQVAQSESRFPTRTVKVKGSELRRVRIGGAQTELFLNQLPFLAVMGAYAVGETVIRDAQALREGEVDCLGLVIENLRKMHAKVGELPDGLVIQGGLPLQGAELDAGGDPRVGVAFSLAGLIAEGETTVANPGPIDQIYGEMFDCFSAVAQEKR
ncbi:MAG: hypothetical protein O7G87_13770 [bacterium]|nr:hypothetical protein [bacterium]